MSIQGYQTSPSRNSIRAAQDMLAHAQSVTVLGDFGMQKKMPQNATETLVFRRTLPFGAAPAGRTVEGSARYVGTPGVTASNFILGEGQTPAANGIQFQDVTVSLQQFGLLFKFSSRVELLYEDNVPEEMSKLVGDTLGEVLELVRYGVLKAGSVVLYSNGSSRAAVNTPISINMIRKAARTLESNRAKKVTKRLAPGPNYATRAVQPAFLVFVHTDGVADVRGLQGFTKVEEYGQFQPVHANEFGNCEDFRFIKSPLLTPFYASGSATLNGCLSEGGAAVDVYPFLVIAEDAWGQVALRGMEALTPRILPSGDINHANPMGQFGFVGASTWFAAVRLNEAWMARLECGVSAL